MNPDLVDLVDPNGNKVRGPRGWAVGPFKFEGFELAPSQRAADKAAAEAITEAITEAAAAAAPAKTATTKEK